MDLFRRSRLPVAAAAFVLVLSVVALGVAQPLRAQQVDPNEEFRATLAEFYAEFEIAYAPFVRIGPAGVTEMVARARRSVPSLTPQELAVLRDALPPSYWRNWRTTVIPALHRLKGAGRALEGTLVASTDPSASSAGVMGHSCPQLSVKGSRASAQQFEDALLGAKSAAFVLQQAFDVALADATGIAVGIAAGAKVAAETTVFVMEEIKAKANACEDEEQARILHDVLRPNVDEKVSTRASQTSVDELKKLLTGMLDELKSLINGRADRQEALTNARADRQEALTNSRSDRLEALVNKRTDYIDSYQANIVDHRQVELQVFEILGEGRERLLVFATEAGRPVDATVVSVKVSDLKAGSVFQDVTGTTTVTQVGTGMLELRFNRNGPAKNASAYAISVRHSHGTIAPIGNVEHVGSTVFVRRD
jgi:hypothetical protein